MTERGQITIPKAIRDKCGFAPNIEVEVSLKKGVVVVEPRPDMKAFDEAASRWRGSARARIRKLGFNSSDELYAAVRGRRP